GEPDVEYRPVVFDAKKTRYLPKRGQGGFSGAAAFRGIMLAMNEYRLDPEVLLFDQVKRLGIEAVPAETRREADEVASVLAFQQARDAGIEMLPRPEVGKPYEFTLTAADGRILRSAAFQGKVVVIDCWTGWRAPFMGKLPQIKTLYERRRGDGFEVIGV